MCGIVEVLRHPEPEHVVRIEGGAVQDVHVGPQRGPEMVCELLLVGDPGDLVEPGPERSEALRLDPLLVHEAGVGVADLLCFSGRSRFGGLLDQIGRPLRGQLGEHRAVAPAAAVRRDLGGLEPASVGESEEVVAGLHGRIHSLHVQPVIRRGSGTPVGRRGARWLRGRGCTGENGSEHGKSSVHGRASCHGSIAAQSGRASPSKWFMVHVVAA